MCFLVKKVLILTLLLNQKGLWDAYKFEASLDLADDLAHQDFSLGLSKNTKSENFYFLIYCAHAIVALPVWSLLNSYMQIT